MGALVIHSYAGNWFSSLGLLGIITDCIRARIEGGQRPKGGPILASIDTFFGAEKWELLEIFWEKLG